MVTILSVLVEPFNCLVYCLMPAKSVNRFDLLQCRFYRSVLVIYEIMLHNAYSIVVTVTVALSMNIRR